MKHTIHPKAVTLLISGLLVCLLVFWAQAQAKKKPTPTPTPTPTPEKKIRIEDAVERREGKNKIIFKSEFELAKQSENSAVLRKKNVGTKTQPGGVVGQVVCDCVPDGSNTNGHCPLHMNGTIATCDPIGGCSCVLSIETK